MKPIVASNGMQSFVDIHAHVIPGIDDGPQTMEETLALARAAAEVGICRLVATPHLRSDFPDVEVTEIAARLNEVRAAVERELPNLNLNLICGAEVSLTWALSVGPEQLRLASYGQRGRDLLIETPSVSVVGLEAVLYQLRSRGYRITLAHPERTRELQDNKPRLVELVEAGILLQINAESLLGEGHVSLVGSTARWLCREGLAHAVASDAHRGHTWRAIDRYRLAVETLSELVGPGRAEWMASHAPAAIVEGVQLPPAPEITAPARRKHWRLRRHASR